MSKIFIVPIFWFLCNSLEIDVDQVSSIGNKDIFLILIIFLLKTNHLYLNLIVYQICCSILPSEQVENVFQIHLIRNYMGD